MSAYNYKRIYLPRDLEQRNKLLNELWDEGWIKLDKWELGARGVLTLFRRRKELGDNNEQGVSGKAPVSKGIGGRGIES